MTRLDRHYRSPALRWAVVASYVVLLLAAILAVAEAAGAIFVVIVVIAGILGIWFGVLALKKGGLQESPDGVTNRRFLADRAWRWEEIDRFKSSSSP